MKIVILPKWTAVGEIMPANIIPALVPSKPTGHGADGEEATVNKKETECQKDLLDKIGLTGLEGWDESEQEEAWGLITENAGIFAMSDMD